MAGMNNEDQKLSLSKSSSSGTGETGRRSDRRGRLIIETFDPKVGLDLRLEWKVVALGHQLCLQLEGLD